MMQQVSRSSICHRRNSRSQFGRAMPGQATRIFLAEMISAPAIAEADFPTRISSPRIAFRNVDSQTAPSFWKGNRSLWMAPIISGVDAYWLAIAEDRRLMPYRPSNAASARLWSMDTLLKLSAQLGNSFMARSHDTLFTSVMPMARFHTDGSTFSTEMPSAAQIPSTTPTDSINVPLLTAP